jgi:hypothetical protein
MSSSELHTLQKAFTAAGGHWSTFVIWAKDRFTRGRSDCQRFARLCFLRDPPMIAMPPARRSPRQKWRASPQECKQSCPMSPPFSTGSHRPVRTFARLGRGPDDATPPGLRLGGTPSLDRESFARHPLSRLQPTRCDPRDDEYRPPHNLHHKWPDIRPAPWAHIYQVPIPEELRSAGDEYDIRIEVTLSSIPRRPRRASIRHRRYRCIDRVDR